MADKKISALNSAGALAGTEVLPIVQSGETKKLALNAITALGTITTGTWQGTAIADTYLATISTAGKVSNSATTATSANTVSAIVARDSSGNFSAGTITAALTGNASTATALQTARNINGVAFDGTGNITITANTPNALTAGTYLTSGGTFDGSTARTFAVDATDTNTASKVVARDASGNFAAGTITATLVGNASTATALATARTINGVSFDGTGNITVTAAAGTLTGSTLASGVTTSSLTSVGTLTSLTVSGTTTLNAVAYTWPATDGTSGQVLSTNGTGTLSWVAQSGGGGGGATLTIGSFLTGGSYNGSTAVTIAADATSTNTASKLVARDSSGNFAAGAITASSISVSGATTLNTVAYTWPAADGSSSQVLTTNGSGTLSWTTVSGGGSGTTTYSLTAGSYLTGGTFNGSAAVTFAVDATDANTASKVVARDASGDFASSVITVTGLQLNTSTVATANTGRIRWNATNGTPEVRLLGGNVDLDIGSDGIARVLNNTGSPLTLGQVVYITGASGQRATVALARADSEATSTDVIGFVAESISNNQEGFVRTSGIIEGLNTNSFNEGDLIYLSAATAGAFTNVRPTQPNHGVRLGYVVKKNSVDGHIYIDVNNGYELDELHDVLITTPAAYQMVRRNAANTLWVNITGPTGDVVGTSDSQALTNKTISGANNTLSNIGNSSLTNSSVTVNGTSIALGASGTVTANTTNALTLGSGLTGTSFNGSAAITATVDATDASTASKIVSRDGSGVSAFKAVKFDGTSSGVITVQPAAVAGSWSLTLPTGAGTNGQVLTTDGSGVTSWTTASGGISISESTTAATFYPVFYSATSGTATALNTDSSLTWNPSTNTLSAATVSVSGDLTVDTSTLKVDSTNNRVGIVTASPSHPLHVVGTSYIQQAIERATVSATAATGTINYDALTQAVLFYTSNASANWTLNLRGSSTVSMNTLLAVGDSLTVVFMVTQGTTAYYPTTHQIDGSSVTPKWQSGVAPTSGNASGIDVYVYTVIKTAATPTYTVLASQSRFA